MQGRLDIKNMIHKTHYDKLELLKTQSLDL